MTVADAARSAPAPTPDECDHPAPVTGVLANEFAHYEGARGPEGKRRTVTYYGPVVGGLPISAWHCEVCGLLRLTFPDGRREERRLFPGPQPGLLAEPAAVDPDVVVFGMQARVSGLSAPQDLYERLVPPAPAITWSVPTVTLPELETATWLTIVLLSVVAAGLLLGGVLAVYDYQTPAAEKPLFYTVLALAVAAAAVQVWSAVQRRFFPMPRLSPSVASRLRESPELDGASRTAVALLAVVAGGLLLGGFLAVYTYTTPDAERPLFYGVLTLSLLALTVTVVAAAARAMRR